MSNDQPLICQFCGAEMQKDSIKSDVYGFIHINWFCPQCKTHDLKPEGFTYTHNTMINKPIKPIEPTNDQPNDSLYFQFADNTYDISTTITPMGIKESTTTNGLWFKTFAIYLQNNNYQTGFIFELSISLYHKPNNTPTTELITYSMIAEELYYIFTQYRDHFNNDFLTFISTRYGTTIQLTRDNPLKSYYNEYITVTHMNNLIHQHFQNEDIDHIISSLEKIKDSNDD